MIHNTQLGYKKFNLPDQVSTCILVFFKVSQVLPRMRKMRTFSKITPPNPTNKA